MDIGNTSYVFRQIVNFWILFILNKVICEKQYNKDVCNSGSFKPDCGENSVIVVEGALFGRFKLGVCNVEDDLNIGCHSNVMNVVESKCSGRSSCSFYIALTEEIQSYRPCGDLISYLHVTYSCLPIKTAPSNKCQQCDGIRMSEPEGYLSNLRALETGCGSLKCPWLLSAPESQTINMTLYDFSHSSVSSGDNSCQIYAELKESSEDKSHTICNGITKKSLVYSSVTNQLEVRLSSPKSSSFLLYYQFLGCTDFEKDGMTFIRDRNEALLKCNKIDKESSLICRGNQWVGEIPDCLIEEEKVYQDSENSNFYVTIEMIIIIISCVAFTIGGCILILGIYIFCRERNLQFKQTPIHQFTKPYQDYDSPYSEPVHHMKFNNKTLPPLTKDNFQINGPFPTDTLRNTEEFSPSYFHSLHYPQNG